MDSMERAVRRLRLDRYSRTVFNSISGAWLVGGFIRDALMGRPSVDRDFAVPCSPGRAARAVSGSIEGKLVRFRGEETVRLALRDGVSLDFSIMRGTIEEDLGARDFIMNSIAFSPATGVVDPYGGAGDIGHRRIRTLSRDNIASDPLRCLRAFRFASELGFDVEEETMAFIRQESGGLAGVAPERITLELLRLLDGRHHPEALLKAMTTRVLETIIPLKNSVLHDNINKMLEVDGFFEKLPSPVRREMEAPFSQGVSGVGLLRLAVLLRGVDAGRCRIRLSRLNLRRLMKAQKFMHDLDRFGDGLDVFDILFSAGEYLYDPVCLSGRPEWVSAADRFGKIVRRRLLAPSEIEDAGVRGRQLGALLYRIDRERFYGNIRTAAEARRFLSRLLKR